MAVNKSLFVVFSCVMIINFCTVNSMSFYMDGENDVCFFKFFDEGEKLEASFAISGDDENNTQVTVLDPSSAKLQTIEGEDSGEFKITVKHAGEHQLCFFPNRPAENSVAFEFVSERDGGHIVKVAQGTELTEMQTDILSISGVFEQIETNVKYIIERQTKHSECKITLIY